MWADQVRSGDVVSWVYGQAARSLIHERDIAAVAVRALTGHGHAGQRYVLTGPQAVTQAEQVRAIGAAIGRPLRFEKITRQAVRQDLVGAFGNPAFAGPPVQCPGGRPRRRLQVRPAAQSGGPP